MRAPLWAFAIVVAGFILFVIGKLRGGRDALPITQRVPKRVRDQLNALATRARTASDSQQECQAWLEAAEVALAHTGSVSLASNYARRAHAACPGDPNTVLLFVRLLRQGKRHRTLERYIWTHLGSAEEPIRSQLFAELVALYEGPLHQPERARSLRSIAPHLAGAASAPALPTFAALKTSSARDDT